MRQDGSRFMWHQPYQRCNTSVDIQKCAIKVIHSCRITCERNESARERRITLYKSDQQQQLHHDFLNLISDNGLEQLVKEPTRDENTKGLDLFLTNCPQLIARVEIVPGLSDHSIPFCEFNVSTQKKKQAPRKIPL